MTLQNSPLHNLPSKYTYTELFSDKSHYTGIHLQITCPDSVLQAIVFTAYSITSFIHGQHLNLAFCYMLNFSGLMPGHLGQSMISQASSLTVNIGK